MITLLIASALAAQSAAEAEAPYHHYVRGLMDGIEHPESYEARDDPNVSEEQLASLVSRCEAGTLSTANCFVIGGVVGRRREIAFRAAGSPGEAERLAALCATQREVTELARNAGLSAPDSEVTCPNTLN